jgi:hypothetical protein
MHHRINDDDAKHRDGHSEDIPTKYFRHGRTPFLRVLEIYGTTNGVVPYTTIVLTDP